MMTEPKLMSEVDGVLVVDDDPKDLYRVEVEPGEWLVVEMGFMVEKAAARFRHPNIAATGRRVYSFKHYRCGGSKFWTERAGVSHWLVVPRSAVKMLPEKGYSYVPVEVNGVRMELNVSGGSGFDGPGAWTDWVRTRTSVSVNHKLADLKKVCEVAVRGTPMEPLEPEPMEPGREETWARLAAARGGVKEQVVALVEAGKRPVVCLAPGYDCYGETKGEATAVSRGFRPKKDGTFRAKGLVLETGAGKFRAGFRQIDWAATAKANGLGGRAA